VLLAIALLLVYLQLRTWGGKLGVVTVQFFLARVTVTSNTNHANLPELSSEATVSVTAS